MGERSHGSLIISALIGLCGCHNVHFVEFHFETVGSSAKSTAYVPVSFF